jgi:hypothetical protein
LEARAELLKEKVGNVEFEVVTLESAQWSPSIIAILNYTDSYFDGFVKSLT